MTAEKIKRYPGMVIVKKETEARINKLKDEIYELEGRITRAERKHENSDKVVSLLKIKEDRLNVTRMLLEKLEQSTLEVEEALEKAAPDLTPLEHMIVLKHYVEGLSWFELMDLFQNDPNYSRFCYEKSSYMRAHRSALDKIMKNTENSVQD